MADMGRGREPRPDAGTDETVVADEEVEQGVVVDALFAGRYLIEREIGRGGMGTVFAAFDRQLEERVALKLLDTAPGRSAAALERFRREVRVARRVTHRNAARTFDIGEHGGAHYLTMELVDGTPLDQLLRREGALAIDRAADIGRQLCMGLDAAHTAGVIHRDLKPANVLVQTSGRVVITDFGIARQIDDDARVTVEGMGLIGTPAYMAPEQVSGGDVDARSDIYAVGLILFETLTGVLPFAESTPLATAVARLERDPPDPRDLAEVPAPLARLVLACLARNPSDRPKGALQVAEALSSHIGGGGERVAAHSASTWTPDGDATLENHRSRFATTGTGARGLAILPFIYRGPPDGAYLADALTDELIDILSMTRGLRVPSRGATGECQRHRDPRELGQSLGVDAIVDGTLQSSGQRLRISARLIDVATGYQTWSERFDGNLEDVFALQDRMAKRIAETLRMRFETLSHRGYASEDALELYFRARARMNDFVTNDCDGAVVLFEQCIALAPDFLPARSGYAMACLTAWFAPNVETQSDWARLARDAVAEALQRAPDLAETHVAAGRLASQDGDFATAASSLRSALEIAPTHAAAHGHLGALQTEAGRLEEGLRHIELGFELDPRNLQGLFAVARVHGLQGDMGAFEATLTKMRVHGPTHRLPVAVIEMRIRAWHGDMEGAARAAAVLQQDARHAQILPFLSVYLGKQPTSEVEKFLPLIEQGSPRFVTMVLQLAAEACGLHDDEALTLRCVQKACDGNLVDLAWLELCPALAAVRRLPEFAALHERVRARAEAIWRVS
jgi:eukaryotic-like serine/threonine-protein kinase